MPPQPGPWGSGGQQPLPPQQPWGPPPPKQNNTIKWLLIGVGLLLVIAITVGVTVLVTRDAGGGDGASTTTSASGPPIASADDTGPVEIITFEPTCQAWMPLSNAESKVQNNGWNDRDIDKPAGDWNADERAQYEAVAKGLRDSADQTVELARTTPHRVVRELYEQYIAFARAYADSVPTYTEDDNWLARGHIAAANSVDALCNSITYGSAAQRSSSVSPIDGPANTGAAGDPANPARVVSEPSPSCDHVIELQKRLVADTDAWTSLDPNVPATDWPAERRSMSQAIVGVMAKYADDIEQVGRTSSKPVFDDIASFSAAYFRAYSNAIPSYVAADSYLALAGSRATNILVAACEAVGS